MKQIIFVQDKYCVRKWDWKKFKWLYLSGFGGWSIFVQDRKAFDSILLAEEYVETNTIRVIKLI